jgi:hypothetical protein
MTDMMDLRVRNRYVQRGLLVPAEIEKYDSSLVDVSANAEWVDYDRVFAEQRDIDAREALENEDEEEESSIAPAVAQRPSAPPPAAPYPPAPAFIAAPAPGPSSPPPAAAPAPAPSTQAPADDPGTGTPGAQ